MSDFSFLIVFGVLLMYMLSVLGNLIIITVVCIAPQLHSPMYFFLCNLGVQDIIYVSSILPKFVFVQITGDTSILFTSCIIQLMVFLVCLDAEFFLLGAMGFDRYVAICVPLKYSLIMNKKACLTLAFTSWSVGSLNALLFAFLISNLTFCDSRSIDHFFCEIKALMRLSCSDITHMNTIIFVEGGLIGFFPFTMILTSYTFIIAAILKIRTSVGRTKAFSSCSSHLTVVLLFCGTSISVYMKPESENSVEQDQILSLLYIAVVPALNPLVYSLRNREVLKVLRMCKENFF
ncbi:PREDICTED: olfactory receptor 1G1-like [Nanorana parkeri]|uniref:olfactory receptor 1G1-like n=1 Tax=Nanorana parkeri TaxID=125878 RepID=UPI000854198E|nr:PREDICTED: olfactory receptor 1G1-like [Nanorana parkeri]